jgi:hypothetical protein
MDDHVSYIKRLAKIEMKKKSTDLDFLALALVVPSFTLNPKA